MNVLKKNDQAKQALPIEAFRHGESPASISSAGKQAIAQLEATNLPDSLWKNPCISTAANVQNSVFPVDAVICPRSIRTRRKACQVFRTVRKPLTLWSKTRLSTERTAFTIITNFVYILIQ